MTSALVGSAESELDNVYIHRYKYECQFSSIYMCLSGCNCICEMFIELIAVVF
jgi:hypothetical protein